MPMKNFARHFLVVLIFINISSFSQTKDPIVEGIVKEATESSQLEKLAHELMDGIGPRLVGSPKMQQAHDWAVAKYTGWGIAARNEKWGEWRGWERGVSHIDMISPWVKTLEGTQLAWSPSTNGKAVLGEVIIVAMLRIRSRFKNGCLL
jgi:carboxypeptidase Q